MKLTSCIGITSFLCSKMKTEIYFLSSMNNEHEKRDEYVECV